MSWNDIDTSVRLYTYLCNVYGTENVVKLRRKLFSAYETLYKNGIYQIIPSGSRAEGLALEESDYDVMALVNNVRVYEATADINTTNNTYNIIMDTTDTKLGFTRLNLIGNASLYDPQDALYQYVIKYLININGKQYLSNAFRRNESLYVGVVHGPCLLFEYEDFKIEGLFCFRCKEWISHVTPWSSRLRGLWPTSNLINDITQYGVLFVPVGCKTSKYEDIEWRISFSIAEKQLIHSFTHTQFLCYAMMKIVLSDIIKKYHKELLCSYFIKTIMFWLSEENDPNFWRPDNLIHCYMTCLQRLIYCVQYRVCLHYFIPDINFFEDRFNDTEHEALLNSLNWVYRLGWRALSRTKTIINFTAICQLNPNVISTSSVLQPIICVDDVWLDTEIECFKAFIRVSGYLKSTTNSVVLYVISLSCRHYLVTKSLLRETGNKLTYYRYKSVMPLIIISTRTDCVSGWCYLASLLYKLKQYSKCKRIIDDCLSKCTPDKILFRSSPHVSFPQYITNLLSNNRYFTTVMKHFVLFPIDFNSPSLLPSELLKILNNTKDKYISISTVVYLHFLDFLCVHHQKEYRAKKQAFRNLQCTVREKYLMVNTKNQIDFAEKILEVVYKMLYTT